MLCFLRWTCRCCTCLCTVACHESCCSSLHDARISTFCLQTTTEKQLRKQLEAHFNCDLKDRKHIFKEEIESFLLKNQELFDTEANEEASDEEEKPKKKKKRTGVGMRQSLSEQMLSLIHI